MLPSTRRFEDGDLAALVPFQPNNLCFEPSAVPIDHIRPSAGETAPIGWRTNGALAGRRDLKDVAFAHQFAPVKPSFQNTRGAGAVVDRDRCAIPAVDPHFDHRPAAGPASPKLDKVETDRVKLFRHNALQLVVHASS
jgi:hypothetical protein